jgi:hypothetical protein
MPNDRPKGIILTHLETSWFIWEKLQIDSSVKVIDINGYLK